MTDRNSPKSIFKGFIVKRYAQAARPRLFWRLMFRLVAHGDIQLAKHRQAACDHGDWRHDEDDRICGNCGMVMED